MYYQTMCDRLCRLPCSDDKLNLLKTRYQHVINSKRRSNAIDTLPGLITIFQKRDYINPDKIDVLEDFIQANFQDFHENDHHVQNLNNVHVNGYQGLPNLQRGRVLPRAPSDTKERAYQVIIEEIGQKWNDFARALHVPEGSIDQLSKIKFEDRIYDILLYHEERSDPKFWQSELVAALDEARRRDLSQRVQRIFDTFS